MNRTALQIIILSTSFSIVATTWHVDPQSGSPLGDGSIQKPWQTLQEVVDSGLIKSREGAQYPFDWGMPLRVKNEGAPIGAGDTILLGSGYHGAVIFSRYYNEEYITIKAKNGCKPTLKSLKLQAVSQFRIIGLTISPQFAPDFSKTTLITLESHNYSGPSWGIEVAACTLFTVENSSKWTKEDWNTLSCNGFSVSANKSAIHNNVLKNVNFGISVSGDSCFIDNNTIENFAGDGLRGLGNYGTFSNNTIMNCYDVNANHDDGFQSWSVGENGVGTGVVKGIILSGNTFINYTNPNQAFRGTLQGIGCFDGYFEDWVVENNVVVTDHWHGISLYGARNCRIINNTVCDLNKENPGPPWIMITSHKNGQVSENCIVQNNLSTKISVGADQGVVADHNVIIDDPLAYFVDYNRFDLHLKSDCKAIDAGTTENVSVYDKDGAARVQGSGVDAGAYEFGSSNSIYEKKRDGYNSASGTGYQLMILNEYHQTSSSLIPCFQLNGVLMKKTDKRLQIIIGR